MIRLFEFKRPLHHDVAAALRAIADEIENGCYGSVSIAATVLLEEGGDVNVFGHGPLSEQALAVSGLLHRGMMRLDEWQGT